MSQAFVHSLRKFFDPDQGAGLDANGSSTARYYPYLETGLFDTKALATFQFAFLRYLLDQNTNLLVEYNTNDVADSAGWNSLEDLFTDTGGQVERIHAKIAHAGRSVAFRITCDDSSEVDDFRLYSIEASLNPRNKFR